MPIEKRIAHVPLTIERRKRDKPVSDPKPDAEPDDDTDTGEDDEEGEPPATIAGHAIVYNQKTTLYSGRYWRWTETVRPGAAARAIKEGQDVRSLLNHDANFVLGRTKSGTLELSEDATGLMTRTRTSGSQTVNDLVVIPIERGDIDGMSFAFSIAAAGKTVTTDYPDGSQVVENSAERITFRHEGDCLIEEREILDIDMYDISPVTYPAYTGTDLAVRALGPDIESRAKLMDVPHVRPAPLREQYRRRLQEMASLPSESA